MPKSIENILKQAVGAGAIVPEAPMAEYTSFRAGGKADWLVEPTTREELAAVLRALTENTVPFYVLGNGSNTLVRDGGYRGVIVKIGPALAAVSVVDDSIIAQAGASLKQIAATALAHHLSGFEFAAGIPGSLGGALHMNAGAYDGELKDVVSSVETLSLATGRRGLRTADEMNFGYRQSCLGEARELALAAILRLNPGHPAQIKAKMEDFAERRRAKQPLQYPSGGSFFKRPPGQFAGKLIQEAGLMGRRVGGASVSTLHAGFIINDGQATVGDILELMRQVQETVWATAGVHLEPEIRIIGEP